MKTLILIFVFLVTTCLYSTIINIPADQPTIQAGINAAVDADTVLVQSGTYVENINYNGKLITVASLFLTTQDTSYISQTIIDGNQNGIVVIIGSGVDSTAVLSGFTITNGYAGAGAGINCSNSSPTLQNITIINNTAYLLEGSVAGYGGGISCWDSSPILQNVTITGNSSYNGGGIYCYNSSPILQNVTITGNSVEYGFANRGNGGGIYCAGTSPSLLNVTITGNSAERNGGGIYCAGTSPSLVNVTITDNSASYDGGGILCNNSSLSLENVTITGNTADGVGGGIYCNNSSLSFEAVDRCNIFLNSAGLSGCDLYAANCPTIDVVVDTFTVLQPNDYFACPIDNFTFDILNAKVEQVDQDLYVSPDGSDDNSGLTVNDPLLTISYALTKILPDSTNTLTIHLSNGTYSPSGTGEIFPLYCRSYVSLLGEDEASTILDGEELSKILWCYNDNDFSIENMTIQNGSAPHGGGIYCKNNSSPSLANVTITGNSAWVGGGIYCENSSLSLANVTITGNSGGGIYCENSSPSLENVTITGNSVNNSGGGIYCFDNSNPSLVNVSITDNTAYRGGGICCYRNSSPSLVNVTLSGNTAIKGGGVFCCWNSNPSLINCILWNDTLQEVYFYEDFNPNSITITYSDIQGGEAGIVTNNNGTVYWLEGNIDEDPLFVGIGDHPFMLQDLSSCVNAGIPDTTGLNLPEFDLAGNPRVYGGRIDMGAYENQNVVGANENLIPLITKLNQNYPNPFNPTTTINYSLKENSKVSLNIYNIKGQKVKQLVSDQLPAGQHSVIWNGKDKNGKTVSSGIYFYKLKTRNYEKTRKMILMK
ncbi:MAG: DUF1565 domain-containing protein [Candidatus Cloacimonetes bacterium]|nr:DUF1565 domain-containing protein [Candidatus Cloacimonadota bacterium]